MSFDRKLLGIMRIHIKRGMSPHYFQSAADQFCDCTVRYRPIVRMIGTLIVENIELYNN